MAADVMMTWISGASLCSDPNLQVYLNSAVSCGFKGDRVVFTHDMPEEFKQSLIDKGFKVITVPKEEVADICKDRHLHYYKFLRDNNSYRYVIITDSRDVYFQRNPVEYLDKYIAPFVLLVAEGIVMKGSIWNELSQNCFQKDLGIHTIPFDTWTVINAGTIAGTRTRIASLEFDLWLSGIHIKCSDQCGLNYIYRYISNDTTVKTLHPSTSEFCLTGEGVIQKQYEPHAVLLRKNIINPKLKKPYFIFHQWDRTEFKDFILKRSHHVS